MRINTGLKGVRNNKRNHPPSRRSQATQAGEVQSRGPVSSHESPRAVPRSGRGAAEWPSELPPHPLLPSARELPKGPRVHTVAVDQNDGQHVILAQHLPRPASALSPVRPLSGDAWEPSLSSPESAGQKGRLRAARVNKRREPDWLRGSEGGAAVRAKLTSPRNYELIGGTGERTSDVTAPERRARARCPRRHRRVPGEREGASALSEVAPEVLPPSVKMATAPDTEEADCACACDCDCASACAETSAGKMADDKVSVL